MKKNAFTLGEILIVLVLVGLLSVLALQTVKSQKAKFTFSCYHFFRDLKITVGHMAASTYGGTLNSFNCERALDNDDDGYSYETCMAAGKASSSAISDPYVIDYRSGSGFCTGLATAMATASSIKCSDSELNNATLDNIYGNIASGQSENFRLMNKYLIYVSNRVTGGSANTYRIVSVDLNGSSPPNKVDNDIISFAIFDNGEILPLGEAAINNNYFTTVIKIRNILPMPASNAAAATRSVRHPTALIFSSDKKPLTFKEAYCDVYGSSSNYPAYCNGYTDFSESFKIETSSGSKTSIPVSYCSQSQYNADGSAAHKVDGQDFVAECEMTVIKPQISKFFPVTQDAYSSINNTDDVDENTNESNQIYKY